MAVVLVTCAGSGVGQSVIDSLNKASGHTLIGCDMVKNVYARLYCHKFETVPGIYTDEYLPFLIKLCAKHNVDVVVPGHDYELLLFSRNKKMFDDAGLKVLVSHSNLIEISRDKQLWFEYFGSRGCNIVPTVMLKEFRKNVDKSFFPGIVKPAGGSASQGISIVHKPEDIEGLDENLIIQPYLFPDKEDPNYASVVKAVENGRFIQASEISIQVTFNQQSEVKGLFISKNSLKNGVPVTIEPYENSSFSHLDEIMKVIEVCKQEKVVGPVNIQGRLTGNELCFFEMNMRFTGITGNRSQFGFNEVHYLVQDILGKPTGDLAVTTHKVGVRQVACSTVATVDTAPSKKSLTVLGGGGFVGSTFIDSLDLSTFQHVNIVCRPPSLERYKRTFATDQKIRVVSSSSSSMESIYASSDVLVNFASALAYQPEEEVYDAIVYQYEQVQKIIKAQVPLVINVSSQSVYDQSVSGAKKEGDLTVMTGKYAFQKNIAEKFWSSIHENLPATRVHNLRFGRILGGAKGNNGFFGKIVETVHNGGTLNIQNLANEVNLLHVDDAVSSVHFLINLKELSVLKKHNVLNVGGENVSMFSYVQAAYDAFGKKLPEDIESKKEGNGERVTSTLDISLIEELGWKPDNGAKDIVGEIHKSIVK